jgi:hypothetical protein
MRDPDQLPSVLLNLLEHPGLKALLKQPQALTIYLDKQGWHHLPEDLDGPWGAEISPDSQEASDQAEIMPMVEQKLEDLELTQQQMETLKAALIQTCPECRPHLQILLPNRSVAPA